ncbi:Para-aminobenzoate synthase, subunit I [Mycoavidus cysteinexigens]|uniref:Para-aminobenzoate synthase, subunit I n=1 Tax=Mycoavidus cysteinexigens TaxID=1553431 RepID=A0A2Z6ES91_9BURK|nr:chorismate-binding protein [Mycoavidus cysteinexigens]BBE08277.1 Para-aminobenzoate synthase, subunit I [Mycoavidus cysteinexigens]GAM53020.1 para-aminobenzoate synthase, aminase component [bacterium endosymbiont of Mortierella elongata FMR23-6]GLR02169.1 chloride transporter [Mycoavidus cysteinexigens]
MAITELIHPDCFALLDDCNASEAAPTSRLYTDLAHQRICPDLAAWESVCSAVEADLRAGLHGVVLADYEWGVQAQLKPQKGEAAAASGSNAPSFRFLLFRECAHLSRPEVDAWLVMRDAVTPEPSIAGIAEVRPSVQPADFDQALSSIQAALSAGEAYQINYTYRLHFSAFGAPMGLYRRLRARQPVPYGALIALPNERWIISCSPELFLRHQAGQITAQPMKGTAARSGENLADANASATLASDPKTCAENLMIVDLLRNDISRIAQTGSVQVPELFSVEPHATVWQMTSTVTAQLRAEVNFATVMRALFPSGSITGAPKYRAMQLIGELENTQRGLYTGAVGWLDAPSPSASPSPTCGDFCLSVAIRTLTLDAQRVDRLRDGCLGIGAGIVYDSVAAHESAECALKADFLTKMDPGFALIETMYATREHGVRYLERHWERLYKAASYFGFKWDMNALRMALDTAIASLPVGSAQRLRVTLDKPGRVEITSMPFVPLTQPVSLRLAIDVGFTPVAAEDIWLRYKTTVRGNYERALAEAKRFNAFDLLFCNTRGEITEGARSNVFIQLKGHWFTPPVTSGLLPGVMRAVLLDDASWGATERVLTLADLYAAKKIIVCNALHGVLEAKLAQFS